MEAWLESFFDTFNPFQSLNGARPDIRNPEKRRALDVEGVGDKNLPENVLLHEEFIQKGGKVEDEYFTTSRGLRLFARTLVPKNPRGGVIICHSYCSNLRYRHKKTMHLYALRGYVATGVEYEGHGWSDGLHASIEDFEGLIKDFDEFILRQEGRYPDIDWIVHGESLGGCVALHLCLRAQEHGRKYNGAVLVAPMCKVANDVSPTGLKVRALNMVSKVFPTLSVTPIPLRANTTYKDPQILEALSKDPVHYYGKMRLATARECYNATLHLEKRVPELETPFCVMHGTDDVAVPVEGSQWLYEESTQVAEKDKELILIDDGWHGFLWAEEDKEKNWITLLDWASARLE